MGLATLLGAIIATAAVTEAARIGFSAGFTDDAVLQRGPEQAAVYGWINTTGVPTDTIIADSEVSVVVHGKDADGNAVSYTVTAERPAPGQWKAMLRVASAGGKYTISATFAPGADGKASIQRVTFGDVWFCGGQSNMALETWYTFREVEDKHAVLNETRYHNVRTFMMGNMGLQYRAFEPQWVTTQGTPGASCQDKESNCTWWTNSAAAKLPSVNDGPHGAYDHFAAACRYFAHELTDQLIAQGHDPPPPLGMIQSAVGGTQIETWMDNATLTRCKNESLVRTGVVAPPALLYYGMAAPFVNTTLTGFLWYQGENNMHNDMGSTLDATGYACELQHLVSSWRAVWSARAGTTAPDAPWGIATIAPDGSEGTGQHMAGMRWAETANVGHLPNRFLPNTFSAQLFDLQDPWAYVGDGDTDRWNCSNPSTETGLYGKNCSAFDPMQWPPLLRRYAAPVRENSPGGVPKNNFMESIHVRLKGPVGRRWALAAVNTLAKYRRNGSAPAGPVTGPTIAGCALDKGAGTLEIAFNASLLAGDTLWVNNDQTSYTANASAWKGVVDANGLMVCATPAPAPPHPANATCMTKCLEAGHCCVGARQLFAQNTFSDRTRAALHSYGPDAHSCLSAAPRFLDRTSRRTTSPRVPWAAPWAPRPRRPRPARRSASPSAPTRAATSTGPAAATTTRSSYARCARRTARALTSESASTGAISRSAQTCQSPGSTPT